MEAADAVIRQKQRQYASFLPFCRPCLAAQKRGSSAKTMPDQENSYINSTFKQIQLTSHNKKGGLLQERLYACATASG